MAASMPAVAVPPPPVQVVADPVPEGIAPVVVLELKVAERPPAPTLVEVSLSSPDPTPWWRPYGGFGAGLAMRPTVRSTMVGGAAVGAASDNLRVGVATSAILPAVLREVDGVARLTVVDLVGVGVLAPGALELGIQGGVSLRRVADPFISSVGVVPVAGLVLANRFSMGPSGSGSVRVAGVVQRDLRVTNLLDPGSPVVLQPWSATLQVGYWTR